MDIYWSKNIDEVLKVGVWLGEYGINNWALTKSQALEALDKLLVLRIAVLGGDVVEAKDYIRPNYDSWSSDPQPGERNEEYLKRSIEESKSYIEQYPAYIPGRNYFVLVCKEINNPIFSV